MMLEYRQNIQYNYMNSNTQNIDNQLAELNTLCKRGIEDYQLYQTIRTYIYKDIKIKELAITKVLKDLIEIRKKSKRAADIIEYFICYNDWSYSEVAYQFGTSKQLIHQTIQKYSADYEWLNNLIKIKGAEDSKNENNRTKFFSGNKKMELYQQLDFFITEDQEG